MKGLEILEHWQRLKVHGMSLERYMGEGKMELLKREVESSTGIELKTIPRWLINEDRLREHQEAGNKRGSAIIISVREDLEARQLCASGLRFGGVTGAVENFWETGPNSVCMTCWGIGHERMGKCGNQPMQGVICSGPHTVEDHCYGVTECNKGKGKICVHVIAKCVNCKRNHTAHSPRCPYRYKAGVKARREKKHEKKKENSQAEDPSNIQVESQEKSLDNESEMDLGPETWSRSPKEETPGFDDNESRDYTKEY